MLERKKHIWIPCIWLNHQVTSNDKEKKQRKSNVLSLRTYMISHLPFFDDLNESSFGTYCISYTSVVFGKMFLSLLILYTAYLNATSMALSFCSSVKIAPVLLLIQTTQTMLFSHMQWKKEKKKKKYCYKIVISLTL